MTSPWYFDAADAKARAEQAHRDLWASRNTVENLTLPPAFATLQPGETLEVVLAGRLRRLNVTRTTIAASGLVEIAAAVEQGVTWLPRTASRSGQPAGAGHPSRGAYNAAPARLADTPR